MTQNAPDLILGWTSMAQLSPWQDYASHKLYIQQILTPLMVRNNICMLPGKIGIVWDTYVKWGICCKYIRVEWRV